MPFYLLTACVLESMIPYSEQLFKVDRTFGLIRNPLAK